MGFTKSWKKFARRLTAGAALLSVSGCYNFLPKLGDAQLASYSAQSNSISCGASGASVFKASVHPYLKTNCVDCHTAQSPTMAVADGDAAYLAAKPSLNLTTPNQSLLYVRATDNHCGTAGCQKSGADLLVGMKAWADAENTSAACPSSGDPNGIPGAGVMLRVGATNLQQVVSASQVAAVCTMYEIAFVQDGVAAIPSKDLVVRIAGAAAYSNTACTAAATSVTLIGSPAPSRSPYAKFYVMEPAAGSRTMTGTIDGYAIGFTAHLTITPFVAPSPSPSPVPSPSPTPSPSPSPSPKPSVSPSPSPSPVPSPSPSPSPTPAPTPCSTLQRQNAYGATVWPLAKTNCAGCHASGSKPQFANSTLSTAYPIAKGLVTPTNPTGSRLYTFSKNGHCGACTAAMGASFLTQMNLWFPAETTNNCSALTTPH